MEGLACLMIDLQECFLGSVQDAETLKRRLHFTAESCKLLGIPLLFSEQVPEKLGATIDSLKAIDPDAPVFSKNTFSAWRNETLKNWIRENAISHLMVAGIETPICVYQTVIEAVRDDMEITVLSDAIGGRRPEDAEAIFNTFRQNEVLLLPSESVFYALMQDVKHPCFRAFTQLVKRYA
jgi:hypothetical protein